MALFFNTEDTPKKETRRYLIRPRRTTVVSTFYHFNKEQIPVNSCTLISICLSIYNQIDRQ